MWDVLTGEPIKRFDAGFTVTSLAWDNTADFFYAGLQDGRIQVWNRQTGMIEKVFTGHTGCVSDLSLSPAGKLASVGTDGTLRFWNKADGQWLACIEQGDKKPWMLFDNNGYWDGSSDCADLVSVVEGLNVWKVDQFAVYSNRPDILAQSWDSSNSSISLFYAWYLCVVS